MIAKPLCRHRRGMPADNNNYIVIRILVKNELGCN
jgi:hypothetical protein